MTRFRWSQWHLWTPHRCHARFICDGQRAREPGTKLELLQGTLDLMVLQTLDTMGAQHGYGIARRIEQTSGDILRLNEGTVYAALMRLQHRRWISASWGTSEANRKAKFYAITVAGKRQLAREVEAWDQLAGLVARLRGAQQG
jgi:PadR family transcriptional regulator PadR